MGPVVQDSAGRKYSPKLRVPYCEKHAREVEKNQRILKRLLVSLVFVAIAVFGVGHVVFGVSPFSGESFLLLVAVALPAAVLYWVVKQGLGRFFRLSLLDASVFGGGLGIKPKLEPAPLPVPRAWR